MVSTDGSSTSAIQLVDRKTGRIYPASDPFPTVHASGRVRWRSPLVFELHHVPPHEYEEHAVVGHQLFMNIGTPVRIGWRVDDRRHEAALHTGALCMQSDGEVNAPLWRDAMTFACASIPHSLVTAILRERAPDRTATFVKQHCVEDPVAHAYVRSLLAEIAAPAEPLFAETLSFSFVLHLLAVHGQTSGRKQLAPKGRLRPAQLRSVLELVHEAPASNLTLERMATCTGYSPFQFARLFKATTGLAPHAFVLRMRLERACRLLVDRNMRPADVALEVGFYDQADQAHFTNVFRKAFGKSPGAFALISRSVRDDFDRA
jgi:AraC family transcriptional regulator